MSSIGGYTNADSPAQPVEDQVTHLVKGRCRCSQGGAGLDVLQCTYPTLVPHAESTLTEAVRNKRPLDSATSNSNMEYRFQNLLGAPYRGGSLVMHERELLSPVGNRVLQVQTGCSGAERFTPLLEALTAVKQTSHPLIGTLSGPCTSCNLWHLCHCRSA